MLQLFTCEAWDQINQEDAEPLFIVFVLKVLELWNQRCPGHIQHDVSYSWVCDVRDVSLKTTDSILEMIRA